MHCCIRRQQNALVEQALVFGNVLVVDVICLSFPRIRLSEPAVIRREFALLLEDLIEVVQERKGIHSFVSR